MILRAGDRLVELSQPAASYCAFLRGICSYAKDPTREHEVTAEAIEHVCCVMPLCELFAASEEATPGGFKSWAAMDEHERCAAREIRFDQHTWDAASSTRSTWSKLSSNERVAAVRLGYTARDWDDELAGGAAGSDQPVVLQSVSSLDVCALHYLGQLAPPHLFRVVAAASFLGIDGHGDDGSYRPHASLERLTALQLARLVHNCRDVNELRLLLRTSHADLTDAEVEATQLEAVCTPPAPDSPADTEPDSEPLSVTRSASSLMGSEDAIWGSLQRFDVLTLLKLKPVSRAWRERVRQTLHGSAWWTAPVWIVSPSEVEYIAGVLSRPSPSHPHPQYGWRVGGPRTRAIRKLGKCDPAVELPAHAPALLRLLEKGEGLAIGPGGLHVAGCCK